jgi:hypothetical protein
VTNARVRVIPDQVRNMIGTNWSANGRGVAPCHRADQDGLVGNDSLECCLYLKSLESGAEAIVRARTQQPAGRGLCV